jgi:carbamoyl-phosphate synthase large subunit
MGVLEKYGVEMIGARAEAIDKAEDRKLFREAMDQDRAGKPPRCSPSSPRPLSNVDLEGAQVAGFMMR